MYYTKLIPVKDFCEFHQVERTFVFNLEEMGVIQFVVEKEIPHIPYEMVFRVERLMRIQRDFEVRIQDLDLIDELLTKIDELERKLGE